MNGFQKLETRKGMSTLTRSTMTGTVLASDATCFQAIRISICNRMSYSSRTGSDLKSHQNEQL